MVHRALVAAAMLAVAGGCSLLVSTSGLDDGTAADASTVDGAVSTDATDGDGPSDAGSRDADGAGGFCASMGSPPKFCLDFDTGDLSGLDELAGAPTLDTSRSVSPTRSLLADVPGDATERYAKVIKNFGTTPRSFELSFDVYVEQYDPTKDVELPSMVLRVSGVHMCSLGVAVRRGNFTFDEYCVKNDVEDVDVSHRTTAGTRLGLWTHVNVAVDLQSRVLSMSVEDAMITAALSPKLAVGALSLAVGINYLQNMSGRAKTYFDNVRFDFR